MMSGKPSGVETADNLIRQNDETEDQLDRARFRTDQSFIAKFMMGVFGLSVVMTLGTIAFSPGNAMISMMLEVIKIAVVPMTALVIGYYLPKSGR